MTETLDMKVTISAVATPTLYRTMMSVANPRERAALLKRVAEDYLRVNFEVVGRLPEQAGDGAAALSVPEVALEAHVAANVSASAKYSVANPVQHERARTVSDTSARTAEQSNDGRAAKDSNLAVTAEDDAHYDFLENNLMGFG